MFFPEIDKFSYLLSKTSVTIASQNIMNMQNFILLFMSLLTTLIVEKSHILAGIYFIFLRNVLDET